MKMPEIKNILYATDLSEPAKNALSYAMGLAKQYDAKVTVLHVIPDMSSEFKTSSGLEFGMIYDDKAWEVFSRQSLDRAKAAVAQRVREVCEGTENCPITLDNIKVELGHAVNAIVKESAGYDLIVMGTHGHGRIGGLLVGSVAQGVISKAHVPVLVVRLEK